MFVCRHGWIRTRDSLVSIPPSAGITGVYLHTCLRTEIWIGVYGFSGLWGHRQVGMANSCLGYEDLKCVCGRTELQTGTGGSSAIGNEGAMRGSDCLSSTSM